MDVNELVKKFGQGVTPASEPVPEARSTPYDHLISKYGKGVSVSSEQQPAPTPQQQSHIPTPLTDAEIKTSQENFRKKDPEISSVSKHIIKIFDASKGIAGEAISDFQTQKPATGLLKGTFGLFGMAAAPIIGPISAAKEQVAKFTGNHNFAERLEFVATSGLPVGHAIKAAMAARPSSRAINEIVDVVGIDNIPKVLAAMRSNPRLTLSDVSPGVQIITQGLAAKPGQPANLLHQFANDRMDTRKGIIVEAYDEAMGVPINIKDKIDALKKDIREVGKEINPVIKDSKPVDVTPVINEIDLILRPGVTSVVSMGQPLPGTPIKQELAGVRKLLTDGKQNRVDPQELHIIQSNLRAKAEDLKNSSNGQDRQIGYALSKIRESIVTAIDNASPQITKADGTLTGSFRPALAKYRDEMHIQDAFNKGQLITRNKLGQLDDRPEYWQEWIKNATPQELEAARQGARLAIAYQMDTVVNAARKGTDIPNITHNTEKLSLLFGKKEVTDMLKIINDEKKIAETNSKLIAGSMTAMRLLGAEKTTERLLPSQRSNQNMILPLALEAGNTILGSPATGAGAVVGLILPKIRDQVTKQVGQRLDRKTNLQIAELASATGPAKDELIKALQAHLPAGKLTMSQKLQLLPTVP